MFELGVCSLRLQNHVRSLNHFTLTEVSNKPCDLGVRIPDKWPSNLKLGRQFAFIILVYEGK